MHQLRQLIDKVAPTNSRVMISGPSGLGQGTGRAADPRAVAPRATAPFVALNAADITPERMEARAVRHRAAERRRSRKVGVFEEAHGGTLYLDEVADMPRETQNKILRVLVDQTFQRVGGATKVQVDVRIISSTARDLEREIADGRSARTCSTA